VAAKGKKGRTEGAARADWLPENEPVIVWDVNKRLEKRHKRQVARAKTKGKISQPDVRTQEQIEAAREASKPKDLPK
jgi:hypothetical protein